jgi:hypothetical protein
MASPRGWRRSTNQKETTKMRKKRDLKPRAASDYSNAIDGVGPEYEENEKASSLRPPRPGVMNPELYRRLLGQFDRVEVRHRGQDRVATLGPDFVEIHRLQVDVRRGGETYCVRCCFCQDEGRSLAVTHRYGQHDEPGQGLIYLAWCFNGACMRLRRDREALADMLGAQDGKLEYAPIYIQHSERR